MPDPLPGKGLLGWLGRQVGHVKNAAKGKPTSGPTPKPKSAAPRATRPKPTAPPPAPAVIYREDKVEEAELPDRPGVKLRRTIIDEVIVETKDRPQTPRTDSEQ